MKLMKYTYHVKGFPEFDNWITDEIYLEQLNLIVGKNAAGKSRVATTPVIFAGMILQNEPVYLGEWNFTFIREDKKSLIYNLKKNYLNITEKLSADGKLLLKRSKKSTKLYSCLKKGFDTITPPDSKLVLHIRRDKEEYPYLEDIVTWAEQTHFFKFGQVHSTSFLREDRLEEKLVTVEDIPELINQLNESLKDNIIKDFNQLGYNIEQFYAKKENGKDVLYVKEKNLKYDLRQSRLSQGMFRALSLIVFIYYLIDNKKAKTIIVDDLGEGLDYERATRLGELIFNKFENTDIQFIASSNDSFLMDVVNIRYWNILVKKDNMVKIYNYRNSKDKFDSFKFSGLSSFDLFSSDYLD